MKGILITTKNKMTVHDFPDNVPLYKATGDVIGGFEIVHPVNLPSPYCMIVDDEGLLKNLPRNAVGCGLYGTKEHGSPIVGDIVLLKDVMTSSGPDIGYLNDEDVKRLTSYISRASGGKVRL